MLVATSIPNPPVPSGLARFDKVVHFAMYAILAGLIVLASTGRRSRVGALLATVLLVSAYGALDEWHQQFIPGRSMELGDWLADTIGAMVGATTVAFVLRARTLSPS